MGRKQSVGVIDSIIGREIRRLRVERGLTQRQLARALGSRQPVVCDIELGRRDAHSLLSRLASVFHVTVDHFTSLATPCPRCGGTGVVERASRRTSLREALSGL